MIQVGVLGGGSFGTALAQHLALQGCAVTLWARDAAVVAGIQATRHNPRYLSEFALHPHLSATADLAAAIGGAELVVLGLPSRALRATLQAALPTVQAMAAPPAFILGTKGLESQTLLTMHEVASAVLGAAWAPRIVSLSGPSFAREIMARHPTAVVLAGDDQGLCTRLAQMMFSDTFRAYRSQDWVGVEMGGALKNVMAIAAGALAGLGMGDNTRAAMITRGVAEMSRMAIAKGGQERTLAGLAGVGDLVLTCTGALSRNRAMGEALGAGLSLAEAQLQVGQVAEGVVTAEAAYALAQRLHVDAPIISAVYRVLYQNQPVRDAALDLVRRAPGNEWDDV